MYCSTWNNFVDKTACVISVACYGDLFFLRKTGFGCAKTCVLIKKAVACVGVGFSDLQTKVVQNKGAKI